MKIIIFSDSHGAKNNLQRALLKHPDAQVALFCGDGAADFYSLADQPPAAAMDRRARELRSARLSAGPA